MNFAARIAGCRERGFTQEQSEVIIMMEVAAGVLFRDFPDSFVLFGGATLVLFHGSVRHSADLDLNLVDREPDANDLHVSLTEGLRSAAEALALGPLQVECDERILVKKRDNSLLFKVDISRVGCVLKSEIEEHTVEIDEGDIAKVKSASRDLLLLQKAECFLLRNTLKVRDAFDIYDLEQLGVVLSEQLESHLHDTLMSYEIEAEDILNRIAKVDKKRCMSELNSLLPQEVFDRLVEEEFAPLSAALHKLYRNWL
jgi:hypothetical protein